VERERLTKGGTQNSHQAQWANGQAEGSRLKETTLNGAVRVEHAL
jgi:hypothetical protein